MTAKHVCITGCTKGLGQALALWFLDKGWTVSGFGRDKEAISKLISQAADRPSFFKPADIADENSVGSFIEEVSNSLGVPDLLLNNAGVINPNAPLWEVPPETFNHIIDVNIKGVFNVLRHIAPLMIARESGVMINFSSGWGRSTSPDVAPYCASKWAIEGLSQAMAQELPRGVAVAALNPGIIDTQMLRSCFGSAAASYDDASDWAKRAGPFLAKLDASVNGKALTAP